jgi:hypothetical protein
MNGSELFLIHFANLVAARVQGAAAISSPSRFLSENKNPRAEVSFGFPTANGPGLPEAAVVCSMFPTNSTVRVCASKKGVYGI